MCNIEREIVSMVRAGPLEYDGARVRPAIVSLFAVRRQA
jgi:hypothetical protein